MLGQRPEELRPCMPRRRARACIPCRRKKLRCDHGKPCGNCSRARTKTCTYASGEEPVLAQPPHSVVHQDFEQRIATPTPTPAPAARPPTHVQNHEIETPKSVQGERWYPSTVASILLPTPDDASAAAADDKIAPIASTLQDQAAPIRGVIHKSRYSGPSHWLHAVVLLPDALIWFDKENATRGECWEALQTCKSLSMQIKSRRNLTWTTGVYGYHLPTKHTADMLIDAYFRTFETVYRILHAPTFKHDYEILWENPTVAPSYFVVQVQLCLVLGSCLADDTFSLRPQALQWIREANAWIESSEKECLSIFGIQNMCLLDLASRATQDIYGGRPWIKSGALIRSAMIIGLHRDPATLPGIPKAQTEIRRRLWATIAELALESSLDAGAAPVIAVDDFDCAIPMNLDDVQLDFDSDHDLASRSPENRTDTSLQVALARTFPIRTAIARCTNGIKTSTSYQEIIDLSTKFQNVYRSFNAELNQLSPAPSRFQQLYCQMIMSRYIFTLHISYAVVAPKNPLYTHSRNICINAALRLTYSALPSLSLWGPLQGPGPSTAIVEDHPDEDYARLVRCASGPFRSVQLQATMIIGAELVAAAKDWVEVSAKASIHQPLGTLRNLELLNLMRASVEWSRLRIISGQDNVRDYIFLGAALGGIDAMIGGSHVQHAIEASGKEACSEALSLLTRKLEGISSMPETQLSCEEETLSLDDFWTANWNILQDDTFVTTM